MQGLFIRSFLIRNSFSGELTRANHVAAARVFRLAVGHEALDYSRFCRLVGVPFCCRMDSFEDCQSVRNST